MTIVWGQLLTSTPSPYVPLVSHFYANREATSSAPLKNIPLGVAELLAGEVFESVC